MLLWLHKPSAYLLILITSECSRQGTEAICPHTVTGHMSECVHACVHVCTCPCADAYGWKLLDVERSLTKTTENITYCTECLQSLTGPVMTQQEKIVSILSP